MQAGQTNTRGGESRPFFALLLLAVLPFAALAQTYRWVDADGGVHFTQIPPRTGAYTVIGAASPPAAAPNQDSLNQALKQAGKDEARTAEESAQLAQERAQRDERCRNAISQLAYLDAHTPRRLANTDGSGETTRMSEEQFAQRRQTEQQNIKANCD